MGVLISELKCFIRGMWSWGKNFFRLVPYRVYWKRRIICRACNGNMKRCPICGCFLWLYCRVSTSSCKNWRRNESRYKKYDLEPTKES